MLDIILLWLVIGVVLLAFIVDITAVIAWLRNR